MKEEDANKLKCEHCGSENFGSFVQGASYVLKCLACKNDGPVTTFFSVAKHLSGKYEVIEVDQHLTPQATIWTGEIKAGLDKIQQESKKGKIIWLKKVEE